MRHAPALLSCCFLASITVRAQEWHYLSPTNGNIPANAYGVAFSIGGMGYFGTGSTNAVSGGLVTGAIYRHDPATNTVSFHSGGVYPPRARATAFVVGGYAYIGLGNDGNLTYFADFRKFDPALTYTTPIAPFPGGNRHGAIAFTIGTKAYVGGGLDTDTIFWNQNPSNDLWEYDPATDTWTAKAPMPAAFEGGVAFAVGGKGHVIADNSSALWQYDPVANSWTVKAPIPSGSLSGRSAFVANGLGYVGCGNNTQAFHAYDSSTNTWSSAPAQWGASGRRNAAAYSIGNTGYVVGGISGSSTILTDLWDFGPVVTPAPDTWTQRPFFPGAPRKYPIAFSIGGTAYLGGGTTGVVYLTDFQAYDPAARTWTVKAALPPNADLGFSIGGKGYVTTQAATQNFWEYDPVANAWAVRADLPGGARSRAAAFSVEGKGHVMSGAIGGVRQSDHWIYDPASNTWSSGAAVPGLPKHLATGYAIGNRGYLAGGNTGGSSTADGLQYCYNPALDQWISSSSIPLGGRQAAQAFSVGTMGYYGGGYGGGPAYRKMFHAYDPATNTWTQQVDLGGNYRYAGIGFSVGDKGYVFAGARDPSSASSVGSSGFADANDLWEFNPGTIAVAPKVFLGGALDPLSGLMADDLRSSGLLLPTDPYATIYNLPGGTYSDLSVNGIPTTTGNDAIVDRVLVELRDATNPSTVKASRHVWVQRDGDVVDMDGASAVRFTLPAGTYHLAIRHRNHLGAMTATPIALGASPVVVDFRSTSTATYGTAARKVVGTYAALWPGDATFDGTLKYTGTGNDRDAILLRIGGVVPTSTVNGYHREDLDLDGTVKYTGADNDRDIILQNLGSTLPTATRPAQLP